MSIALNIITMGQKASYDPNLKVEDWKDVHPKNLEGQCAMRKAAPFASKDNSYVTSGVKIGAFYPSGHILVIESPYSNIGRLLTPEFNDDKWIKAPDCMCEIYPADKLLKSLDKK